MHGVIEYRCNKCGDIYSGVSGITQEYRYCRKCRAIAVQTVEPEVEHPKECFYCHETKLLQEVHGMLLCMSHRAAFESGRTYQQFFPQN